MRDSSGLKHAPAWRAAGKPSKTFTGSFSFLASHTCRHAAVERLLVCAVVAGTLHFGGFSLGSGVQ